MKKLTLLILSCISYSVFAADEWTPYYTIEQVQSLASWHGGMIRIEPTQATNPANCTRLDRYDFLYDEGTQESRAALVSAFYTAFTTNTEMRLLIDGAKCSPTGVPLIKGIIMKK